jgi:hypothetical protein
MRLHLAFDFSLGGQHSDLNGGFMSSDWAVKAAQNIRKREESEQLSNATLVAKQKILTEQGPSLWKDVCKNIKQLVADFNAEYKAEAITIECTSHGLTGRFATALTTRELIATFNVDAYPVLSWRYDLGTTCAGEYHLHVSPSGSVVFQDGMVTSTPESISRQMLDGLLG